MTDSNHTATEADPGERIRNEVSDQYGLLARGVLDADGAGPCCGGATAPADHPITRDLYDDEQAGAVPANAVLASLGCGNPTALAELVEGETVLDLGAGGGIDVLLSARRVGSSGKAYGLDMTDEMLELARKNQEEAGVENVEFLKGTIEEVPLPDESVDVIISNCVINLSADKSEVFREAHRVLRPGGRLAVSDIVIRGELDPRIREGYSAWVGCVAGALEEQDYRSGLEAAGFVDIEIEPTRVYTYDEARQVLGDLGIEEAVARAADGQVISAFVRASRSPCT